nr:MAG TPA: hypothetical protein [Caudoviricetes sp.]
MFIRGVSFHGLSLKIVCSHIFLINFYKIYFIISFILCQ